MNIYELPDGYREIKKIDLQKDVKLAVLVNALSLAVAVALFLIGCLIMPIDISFEKVNQISDLVIMLLIISGLMIMYMILHELVHGVFFKKYSGKNRNTDLPDYMRMRKAMPTTLKEST